MKKILFLFLMLSTLSSSEVVKAKVVAVYGGDSFQVLIGNKKQNVNQYFTHKIFFNKYDMIC